MALVSGQVCGYFKDTISAHFSLTPA